MAGDTHLPAWRRQCCLEGWPLSESPGSVGRLWLTGGTTGLQETRLGRHFSHLLPPADTGVQKSRASWGREEAGAEDGE